MRVREGLSDGEGRAGRGGGELDAAAASWTRLR